MREMKITYQPKLEDYIKATEENRLFMCEDEHYVGFKYNEPTVFSHDWDDVTLQARGIAFDKQTGEIVARPFFKFFNYQELINGEGVKTDIFDACDRCGFIFEASQKFRVMDKLDGSLGIIFWDKYGQRWQVKTGGSFSSDQAIWAQKWFDQHVNTTNMLQTHTYCVEILCDEDLHPISYPKEELVLLSVISNVSGQELPLADIEFSAQSMGIRSAEVIKFNSFDEVIPYATNLPKDKEGVVVTFENGFKCKIKGEEFLRLQRAFHSFDKKHVWEALEGNWYEPDPDKIDENPYIKYVETIPEEMPDLREYAEKLLADFWAKYVWCKQLAEQALQLKETRREQYEYVKKTCDESGEGQLVGAVMCFVSNGAQHSVSNKICSQIYKSLKPV